MNAKIVILALLAACVAYGGYWKFRSDQAAVEARVLEERARATKMELEIQRLKSEMEARDDDARRRMIEQQRVTAGSQTAEEIERNRALAEQVTSRNEAEQARFERQLELDRQKLEAQRRLEDQQARRQAMESEADARQRAARDAQIIQMLENERLNARRQQELDSLRQQQQQSGQDAAARRQQQIDAENQLRRLLQLQRNQ